MGRRSTYAREFHAGLGGGRRRQRDDRAPSGPGSVAVATDTAVWIQAQRTPSDPSTDPGTAKPGGGGNEETRWDETPKVFAAPASPRPAGAVLLATIAGGTLTDAREMAGLGGRDIVLSKDIKPADPGTDQDTTTGAGVKRVTSRTPRSSRRSWRRRR